MIRAIITPDGLIVSSIEETIEEKEIVVSGFTLTAIKKTSKDILKQVEIIITGKIKYPDGRIFFAPDNDGIPFRGMNQVLEYLQHNY